MRMAKHRIRGKHWADDPGADIETVAEIKAKLAVRPPSPYQIGLNASPIDFILAHRIAQRQCAREQAEARAQIKAPGIFRAERRLTKNFALEKLISWASQRAGIFCDAMHEGARRAFLQGRPEKVQTMLSEPGKFSRFTFNRHSEASFVAENLIKLMYASETPAAVPSLALARVPENRKQVLLDHTLYILISRYNDSTIEKIAPVLLQAGAKANGLVLADAINKNASVDLVKQLVQSGADFKEASTFMNVNLPRYGSSLERLASLKNMLDLQPRTPATELQDNKIDVTSLPSGKPKAPGARSQAKHRKPLRKFQ